MFCGGGRGWFVDGKRDSGVVPHFGQADHCSAELGFRSGLDAALRADVRRRVAGMALALIIPAHLGTGALPGAVGSELCLVIHFLSLPRHRRCYGGGGRAVGGHRRHDARLQPDRALGSVADGALLGLGQLCRRVERSVLAAELSQLWPQRSSAG